MSDRHATITLLRRRFHAALRAQILMLDEKGIPGNADKDNAASVRIATEIVKRIGDGSVGDRASAQSAGDIFEELVAAFVEDSFSELAHVRPGTWSVEVIKSRAGTEIARFEQFSHLQVLWDLAKKSPELAAVLGNDYSITPDIVVIRDPELDTSINAPRLVVDRQFGVKSGLRKDCGALPFLHANISCKWTLRSDRAQNARAEALNLIRNRKGRLPHIMVVSGEPLPSRLASLALGTGDIDCVYHFALHELMDAVVALNQSEAKDLLETMVSGKRLKDISDLPLDLAI